MAALITNVQMAKEFNDKFMTSIIETQPIEDTPQTKKVKPDS
jgi:hypothetical protein